MQESTSIALEHGTRDEVVVAYHGGTVCDSRMLPAGWTVSAADGHLNCATLPPAQASRLGMPVQLGDLGLSTKSLVPILAVHTVFAK